MSKAGSEGEHLPQFAPPAPSAPDKKQKRNTLIQVAVGLVIVIVLFGFILPSFLSYESWRPSRPVPGRRRRHGGTVA